MSVINTRGFLLITFLFLLSLPRQGSGKQITPSEIVQGVEDLLRSNSSKGKYEIEIIRPNFKRKLKFRFWEVRSKPERSLIVIDEPKRDKGTAFLKEGVNLYMYLPRVRKTIRMPPSMMLNPWMGSDFTNDDLVRSSSISRDYTPEITKVKTLSNDTLLYTLTLRPKPDAPVVWERIEYSVKIPGYLPVEAVYYDEEGNAVRKIIFKDVKEMHGRILPATMEVIPLTKKNYKTVLRLVDVYFDVKIPDRTFSLEELEKSR